MTIWKTFAAGLTALSLAFAAPTQAAAELSDRDKRAIAGGLTALFILGLIAEAHDNKRDRDRRPEPPRGGGGGGGGGWTGPVIVSPTPTPPRHLTVPASCIVTARIQGGRQVGVVGRPCLNRSGFHRFNRLPEACERSVRLGNGRHVQAWAVPCLRRNGIRVN